MTTMEAAVKQDSDVYSQDGSQKARRAVPTGRENCPLLSDGTHQI